MENLFSTRKGVSFVCFILCIIQCVIFSVSSCFAQDTLRNDSAVYIIQQIELSGNSITKDHIILRELTIREGNTFLNNELSKEIERSKENLLNTSLFNFVTFEKLFLDSTHVKLYIILEERWYIWPSPIFEYADRNFSTFIHNKNWHKLNYGLAVIYNNFRGRRETLKLKARFGYKEQFSLFYEKPNIDKNQVNGISIDINYFRKHESDIRTVNNDVVYLEYEKTYLWHLMGSRIIYSYRPKYYNWHKLIFQYNYYGVHDSVATLNPNYLGNGNTRNELLLLGYQFIRDKRDTKAYPLKGYYIDVAVKQDGLKLLGDYSNTYIKNISSYYGKISESWYYSMGIKWKLSSNKNLPYYKKYALGYVDYLHGLDHYVIDGPDYMLSKNYLKYQLLAPVTETLKYIPFKKFNKVHYAIYLNLFFDAGYVRDRYQSKSVNSMVNRFLYSTGLGIDFVTYYDQTLRVEYSLNQFGERGFFIHFEAPILSEE